MTKSEWEYVYQLYIDQKPVRIQVIGSNKKEAYQMVEGQWKIVYPNIPLPKRYRCKLEPVDGPYPKG